MEKAKINYGWLCIKQYTYILDEKEHTAKVGDLLPSWLYASFPKVIRDHHFIRNDGNRGNVITTVIGK